MWIFDNAKVVIVMDPELVSHGAADLLLFVTLL